jgi:hypothetical protein
MISLVAAVLLASADVTPHVPITITGVAWMQYSSCQIEAAKKIDDGAAEASVIAKAVAAQCEGAYWKFVAYASRNPKLHAFLSNYDSAYRTVVTQRSHKNDLTH